MKKITPGAIFFLLLFFGWSAASAQSDKKVTANPTIAQPKDLSGAAKPDYLNPPPVGKVNQGNMANVQLVEVHEKEANIKTSEVLKGLKHDSRLSGNWKLSNIKVNPGGKLQAHASGNEEIIELLSKDLPASTMLKIAQDGSFVFENGKGSQSGKCGVYGGSLYLVFDREDCQSCSLGMPLLIEEIFPGSFAVSFIETENEEALKVVLSFNRSTN